MGSDDADRAMKDLKKVLDEMPPSEIGLILDIWKRRVKKLERHINMQLISNEGKVEIRKKDDIWKQAIRELTAACHGINKDSRKIIETLINEKE